MIKTSVKEDEDHFPKNDHFTNKLYIIFLQRKCTLYYNIIKLKKIYVKLIKRIKVFMMFNFFYNSRFFSKPLIHLEYSCVSLNLKIIFRCSVLNERPHFLSRSSRRSEIDDSSDSFCR